MTSSEKINKGMALFAEGAIEALNPVIEGIKEAFNQILNTIRPIANVLYSKEMTKKKFKKMLQSYGIQRNTINYVISNYKTMYGDNKYTYQRLIATVNLYKKESE